MVRSRGERRESTTRHRCCALLGTILVLLTGVAAAQEVGTIAEVAGSVELQHGGTWSAVALGQPLEQGDALRTGRPGRVRVVFQDNSVLTMADASEVSLAEVRIDRNKGLAQTVWRLVQGQVRAVVSEYYERPRSRFQIETVTAVAGVRGTEFVITFDPVAATSEVVGVSGRVEVHSTKDRVGHAVYITTQELTTVTRGAYPTPAKRLPGERYRQYLEKLTVIGAGKPESFAVVQPVVSGTSVPETERAAAVTAPLVIVTQPTTAVVPVTAPAGSITSTVPGQSINDLRPDAGNLLQQSPPVVEQTQGKLGIHF